MPATLENGATPGFYRRPLPADLIPFASPEGRRLFGEALAAGDMEGWFALAEQFHTQADPAFCGLGTLVVALNALEIDPGRIWKGPWRWYGEELLDCCLPLEQVRQHGLTIDELACLARCNGASARVDRADAATLDDLRATVRVAARASRGTVVAASYSRRELAQTGDGHFSPIGGYHAERDLALILDVARFKYPPHWVPLADLWRAMRAVDVATGRARGWVTLTRSLSPTALFFRISVDDGLEDLARLLTMDDLGGPPGEAPDLDGWIARLDDGGGDRLCRSLSIAGGALQQMPQEHRRVVDGLLAELRATAAFAAVARVRAAAPPDPLRDAALAMVLLALPHGVVEALPAGVRAAAVAARALPSTGALCAEVVAVREQLEMLRRWRGRAA